MDPDKVNPSASSLSEEENKQQTPPTGASYDERRTSVIGDKNVNHAAKLRNPLVGMSDADVLADVEQFTQERGLTEHVEAFRKGALLARHNEREDAFENVSAISEEEKSYLRHEITHKWSQPFSLYFLVILCAGSAIVQGMDQAAVNGAQVSHVLHPKYLTRLTCISGFLLRGIRHSRRVDAGSHQRSALSVLRIDRVLGAMTPLYEVVASVLIAA